jgi:hypothetical protein
VALILQLIIKPSCTSCHATVFGLTGQFILEFYVAGLLLGVLGPLVGLGMYRIRSLRSLAVPTGIGIGTTGLVVSTTSVVMMLDVGAYWQAAIAALGIFVVTLPLPIAILTKVLTADTLDSISLPPGKLLPAEIVLMKEGANYTIRLRDYQLPTSAFRVLMPLIGMAGKEAVGGLLYVTNYRLIFQTHEINRVQGTFDIFLPTIRNLQNKSFLFIRRIRITTGTHTYELVVSDVPALMATIEQGQHALTPSQQQHLQQLVTTHIETSFQSPDPQGTAEVRTREADLEVSNGEVRNGFRRLQLGNTYELLHHMPNNT